MKLRPKLADELLSSCVSAVPLLSNDASAVKRKRLALNVYLKDNKHRLRALPRMCVLMLQYIVKIHNVDKLFSCDIL